jgi:hypothetical protein
MVRGGMAEESVFWADRWRREIIKIKVSLFPIAR